MPPHPVVRSNEPSPLREVPHHNDEVGISRLAPRDFPVHVAIHHVSEVPEASRGYVSPHAHQAPELNVLLGPEGAVVYDLIIGEEARRVESPAGIWIPSNLDHAANVVRGSGAFICMILTDTPRAFPPTRPNPEAAAGYWEAESNPAGGIWAPGNPGPGGNCFDLPIFVAAHEVSDARALPKDYRNRHVHPAPEVDLLIGSPGALVCEFFLGGESRVVESPASVWIPPRFPHAVRRIGGSGTLLSVVMTDPARVHPDHDPPGALVT